MAVFTLTGVSGYLRPSDLLYMRRCDLIPPAAGVLETWSALLFPGKQYIELQRLCEDGRRQDYTLGADLVGHGTERQHGTGLELQLPRLLGSPQEGCREAEVSKCVPVSDAALRAQHRLVSAVSRRRSAEVGGPRCGPCTGTRGMPAWWPSGRRCRRRPARAARATSHGSRRLPSAAAPRAVPQPPGTGSYVADLLSGYGGVAKASRRLGVQARG